MIGVAVATLEKGQPADQHSPMATDLARHRAASDSPDLVRKAEEDGKRERAKDDEHLRVRQVSRAVLVLDGDHSLERRQCRFWLLAGRGQRDGSCGDAGSTLRVSIAAVIVLAAARRLALRETRSRLVHAAAWESRWKPQCEARA